MPIELMDSSQPSKLPPGNFYVIGDIHGECDALAALIDRLPLTPDDLVIQIGDCVSRGPQSFEVVEYWLRFDRCERYVIGGNHELLFYDFVCEGDLTARGYDEEATLQSYARHCWRPVAGDPASIPEEHLRFYAQAYPWTVSLMQTNEYIFTHSGYDLARPAHQQSGENLLAGRVTGHEVRCTEQTVIRGHTPYPKVLFTTQGWIGVDTGCGKGGPLSCLRLPDLKVFTERPRSYRPRWWEALRR
jgi:serine/threonine protein phosphatase 1